MAGRMNEVRAKDGQKLILKSVESWTDRRVAELLSELRSPGLPRCYGESSEQFLHHTDLPSETHYMFEYVEGVSLRSMSPELLSSRHLEHIFEQILDVLAWVSIVSGKAFVHLDISPENIIVTDDQRAVLIDFAASRFLDAESTASDNARNVTAGYAAPEVYFGTMRRETDLYSLAMTILAVLSGKTASALDRATMRHGLKQLDRSFSDRLRHCLSEDPEDRRQAVKNTLWEQSLTTHLLRHEMQEMDQRDDAAVDAPCEASCPYSLAECPFLEVADIMFGALPSKSMLQ